MSDETRIADSKYWLAKGNNNSALEEKRNSSPKPSSQKNVQIVWIVEGCCREGKSLQKIIAGVNKTTNKYHSAFKAMKKFYSTQQSLTEGIDEFYNSRFKNAKHLVTLFNADIVEI